MINNNLNLYQLNRQISLFLMGWGVSSMILGATLFFFDNQFLRAISIQFLLWGLSDFILGVIPIARNKISQRKKLNKVLFINSFLDIIYIIVALGLIFEFIAEGESIIGHGFGVIIQALFLLIFDTYFNLIEINPKVSDFYDTITRFLQYSDPSQLNKSKLTRIIHNLLERNDLNHNELFKSFNFLYKDQIVSHLERLDSEFKNLELLNNNKVIIHAMKKRLMTQITHSLYI